MCRSRYPVPEPMATEFEKGSLLHVVMVLGCYAAVGAAVWARPPGARACAGPRACGAHRLSRLRPADADPVAGLAEPSRQGRLSVHAPAPPVRSRRRADSVRAADAIPGRSIGSLLLGHRIDLLRAPSAGPARGTRSVPVLDVLDRAHADRRLRVLPPCRARLTALGRRPRRRVSRQLRLHCRGCADQLRARYGLRAARGPIRRRRGSSDRGPGVCSCSLSWRGCCSSCYGCRGWPLRAGDSPLGEPPDSSRG